MPYLYLEKTEILLRDQETFSQVSFILLRVEGVKYKSLPGAVLSWFGRAEILNAFVFELLVLS